MTENVDQKEKITIGCIASWGLGTIFLLAGVSAIFSPETSAAVIPSLLIAALLLPPVRKIAHQKTGKSLSTGVRVVLFLILAAMVGATMPETQSVGAIDSGTGTTSSAFSPIAEKKQIALQKITSPVETGKFRIVVDSVETRETVGGGMFNETATDGSVYIIVNYTITNISKEPVNMWSFPSFYLRDANDAQYSFDVGATTAYQTENEPTEKSLSDLNPGITVNGSKAFQVSKQLYDPKIWAVEVDADSNFRVALQ